MQLSWVAAILRCIISHFYAGVLVDTSTFIFPPHSDRNLYTKYAMVRRFMSGKHGVSVK